MMLAAMDISASALRAERLRLNVVTNNIANHKTIREDGSPFQRRLAVFLQGAHPGEQDGIRMEVLPDVSPPKMVYEPGNPYANEEGYVAYPAINPLLEIVDALEATRAYEANATAIEATKSIFASALRILV